MKPGPRSRRHLRFGRGRSDSGIALLEALIAFLVLSLGLLVIGRLQVQLRYNADLSRQRSEAVRIAQKETESLRTFASIETLAGGTNDATSFDSIVSQTRSIDPPIGDPTNTSYQLAREVSAGLRPYLKATSITTSWTDRSGMPRSTAFASMIAGIDPAYTGALGLVQAGSGTTGARARSSGIPTFAKDLGDGRSAFKPSADGTVAFVFYNTTGVLASVCTGIASTRATRDLSNADLSQCDTNVGWLLSGTIRYSFASPPNIAGRDPPLSASVAVSLTGSGYPAHPVCGADASKTVSYSIDGSTHVESVPSTATAASFGLAGWVETGDRYIAYYCAVYPASDGRWSGTTAVVPSGWTIGTGAAEHRVCRYSSDLDHSGKIDANIEHPQKYSGVDGNLPQQNFLVIDGVETCPDVGVSTAQLSP